MPGTSRSGATIMGGLIIGMSRSIAAEFSFFLSIPVMFGASFLKLFKFFYEGNAFTLSETLLLIVASLTSYVVSVFVIKFLLAYIRTNNFKIFGWYRIILGIICLSHLLIYPNLIRFKFIIRGILFCKIIQS